MRIFSSTILGAFLVLTFSPADAQKSPDALPAPTVRPAIDGILSAFETRPLVALENSNISQADDFYAALVRDPRFAREVGNVVVEFGGAAHQDTIDRYLDGQAVSYADLRKVWTDVVGYDFPADMGHINFFAQLRAVNLGLPPRQRIHVWLGEPSIDWSKIKTKADFFPFLAQRDTHAAEVIEKEILGKNKKALVIYGAGHMYDDGGFLKLVEQNHPKAFFTVAIYTGFVSKSCAANFEKNVRDWPTPALATPVRGSSLEKEIYRPGCSVEPRTHLIVGGLKTEAQKRQIFEDFDKKLAGAASDALLILGKAAGLTRSPIDPISYLDLDYRQEANRRWQAGLAMDAPLTDSAVEKNPVSPQYMHQY